MSDLDGLFACQQVLAGLCARRVAIGLALTELADVLASEEARDDLFGVLRAWRRVVAGSIGPETRALQASAPGDATANRRDELALRLAREHIGLTSSELAEEAGCSTESARMTLCGLAEAGHLRAYGENRGRWYGLAGRRGEAERAQR